MIAVRSFREISRVNEMDWGKEGSRKVSDDYFSIFSTGILSVMCKSGL